MEIKADVKPISELMKFYFTIPDYQREYVWKAEEHVAQFFEDIENEFSENKPMNEQASYFIGSIIIVRKPDGDYDVIDGQQRLTTIVLTLCAFREYLKNKVDPNTVGTKRLEEIRKKIDELLYSYDLGTGRSKPRLILQYEEAKDYMNCLIEETDFKGDTTNSINKMMEAYEKIFSYIENIDKTYLLDFITYFLIKVEMVVIIPENISSALKIFETINQRGAGLSPMDLLKNLIFKESNQQDFAKVKVVWKEMISNLEKCGEGDKPLRFLRYFLMAKYYNGMLREDEIYKWIISDEGKKAIKYQDNPLQFAEELKESSAYYRDFVKATIADTEDPNYPSLTYMGHIGKSTFRQHIILLLALKNNLRNNKAAVELLCKNLEVLVFYYTMTREQTKTFESRFSNWAKELRNIDTLDSLKDFIKTKIGAEVQNKNISFSQVFKTISEFDIRPQYRVKYYFGRIENYIRQMSNLPVHPMSYYKSLQIEHIIPKTPDGGNIPQTFKDKNEYEFYLHLLGNLTLVESNINQALNKVNKITDADWFNGKTREYRKSDIRLTQSIAAIINIGANTAWNNFANKNLFSFTSWGKDEIIKRQELLLALTNQIWKVSV